MQAIATATESDGPPSDWPQVAWSRLISSDGRRWHIQIRGEGPPLLLLHGTGASTHSWSGLMEELAADFSLIAVDLPGHGFSEALPTAEMTLPSIASKIAGLLAKLGIAPAALVGHSAGAAIAIRMALDGRMPAPDLIVSVNGALLPFAGLASVVFKPLARVLATGTYAARLFARRAEQAGAVERVLASTGSRPPERSLECYRRLMQRPTHNKAAIDMMAMWDLEGLRHDLARLAVPLELIASGEDLAVPPETASKVRDVVPKARVSYVRKLGHLAHEERPELIADLIRTSWREWRASEQSARSAGKHGNQPQP